MFEAAWVMASIAAAVLVVAVAAWVKLFRGPELRRLDGNTAESVNNVEIASRLVAISFGISAVASALALIGLIAN